MPYEQLKKVLCINDNEVTLWIQKQILNKFKFSEEVITAFNGFEGLEYYKNLINRNTENQNTFPGLILLDLHMPVMDGWEFLYRFSSEIYPHCKNTKVIITSYSIDEVDSERAKKYPFVVDFLTSSLSVDYLESLPRSLLSDELV
ncbi:two-component system response regulator [Daejeonella sp.]|uniref:response regulator n=1 Tax=Daejeonella sp. TaxID=2805397 RepID=UPI00271F647A|nr:response regulator [Daejeonella sp.]MDO8993926.1 response regulator [Daejeonella sp.]MDP2414753.1 response regulator [Daejeonella sp.]